MSNLLLGRISVPKTALFVCDIQEKFAKNIKYFPQVVENTSKLLQASKVMNIPVIYTEQYPKGLGATVPELEIANYSTAKFEKTQFSMMVPEVWEHMKTLPQVDSVILCGIEAHACIRATTMDLIEAGFNVHVVVDTVSSRTTVDRKYALKAMEKMGANMITTESIIFGLAPDAAHPNFKQLQKLLLKPSADTGL